MTSLRRPERLAVAALWLAACGGPAPPPTVEPAPEPVTAPAPVADVPPLPVVVVDPEPVRPSAPLAPLFERLDALDAGADEQAVIVVLGDSHVASDTWTGRWRDLWQGRFGDAGRGLAYPGEPWSGFRQESMTSTMEGDWQVSNGARRSWTPPLGLGGVRVTSDSAGDAIERGVCSRCRFGVEFASWTVHYIAGPDQGSFRMLVDDIDFGVFDASAATQQLGLAGGRLSQGPHTLRIEVVTPPVSLLGIATANDTPGVIVDALGINGARATQFAAFDADLAAAELAARGPALWVVAFGTNEAWGDSYRAGDDPERAERNAAELAETFGGLLARYRAAAPDAACLVMLPPDAHEDDAPCVRTELRCAERSACIAQPPDSLGRVAAVYRAAAEAQGCAVWDTQAMMGGPGGMSLWQALEPALGAGDGVHLRGAGYDALADALYADILDAWASWRAGGDGVLRTTVRYPDLLDGACPGED